MHQYNRNKVRKRISWKSENWNKYSFISLKYCLACIDYVKFNYVLCINAFLSLQWRHNERDCVSNHLRFDCLLNRLFRRGSKKTSKFHISGLFDGTPSLTDGFPSQGLATWKMFPFDDVIMCLLYPTQTHRAVLKALIMALVQKMYVLSFLDSTSQILTHWSQDKVAAVLQAAFSMAFLNENYYILIRIPLKFVPNGPCILIVSQHWIWQWLGAEQAPSHYQIQCWFRSTLPHGVTRLQELNSGGSMW